MHGKVCLVLLHGSGSCGYDIAGYLNSVPIPEFNHNTFHDVAASYSIDILTPTADRRRYSAMGGERCNVWFDRTVDFMRKGLSDSEDVDGAEYSINMVLSIIEKADQGKYDHIFLGGFSMGGGLALHTLRKDQPAKLRGIFTMGSFLVQESAVITGPLGRASGVPLLMMHGESDSMIRCEWGRQTASNLLLRGVDVQFRSYKNVDHEMDTTELADLLDWVRHVLDQHTQQQEQEQMKAGATLDAKESAAGSKDCDADSGSTPSSAHLGSSQLAEGKDGERSPLSPSTSSRARDSKHDQDHHQSQQEQRQYKDGDEMDVAEREIAQSAAELAADRDQRRQQSQYSTSSSVTSREQADLAARSQAQAAGMLIPYTVEYLTDRTAAGGRTTGAAPSVRLRFTVPRDLVAVLTARPVLACGSMFEIQPDHPTGVQVLLQSSDPHSTAMQIGLRLQNRISSGGASLNACPMS